jgi:hypothetical protein
VELLRQNGIRVRPDELVGAAEGFATVATWSTVRDVAARGLWFSHSIEPDLAAWMDEGILARWLLGGYPPVATLVAQAKEVVSKPAAEELDFAVYDLMPPGPGVR